MTTVPTPLVRFRGELEAAIRSEQERSKRRRPRLPVRVAAAAGVAAAVAVGASTVLPGDPGGRVVESASAAQRAAAVLAVPPGSIVHVAMTVTRDGSASLRQESWQQTAPPYDRRELVRGADGTAVETATIGGRAQVYDPASNTVSTGRTGTAPPGATPQPASGEPFREQVLALLRDGKLRPAGRSTVDGRETLSFAWHDGHTGYEYVVDAETSRPVRWRISPAGAPPTTVVFDTYEVLPAEEVSLDLTVHHPDAEVRGG